MESIEEIEKALPKQFTYHLKMDNERSGRFEVNLFKNSRSSEEDAESELIWSKLETK